MRFWPLAALLLAGAPAGAAEPACEIYAYIGDPDPAGTNVRATPAPGAAVLKRLPHRAKDDVEDIAPELKITRFQNGWAQVRDVFLATMERAKTSRCSRGRAGFPASCYRPRSTASNCAALPATTRRSSPG